MKFFSLTKKVNSLRLKLLYFALCALFLLIQILPLWRKLDVFPLIYCYCLFGGLFYKISFHTLGMTFTLGMYQDSLLNCPLGSTFLASFSAYFIIHYFKKKFYGSDFFMGIICFSLISVVFYSLLWTMNYLAGIPLPLNHSFFKDLLITIGAFPIFIQLFFMWIKPVMSKQIV